MKSYPIMLNMQGRRAVVVGGGIVGLRKARGLAEVGAAVTLVAERIADNANLAGIEILRQSYAPDLLSGATLVMACTDSRELNAKIATDASAVGALVNAADQPEDCDFFLPACLRNGDVVVAVGTSGSAPALAGQLRQLLADALPADIGQFATALAGLRQMLREAESDGHRRHEIMTHLAGPEGLAAFRSGGDAALREMLDTLITSNS